MSDSVALLLGVFERSSAPQAAQEDFEGEHGGALRGWQRLGFLAREHGVNPVPGCPECGAGQPYQVGGRLLCDRCRSTVDPRRLLLWRLDIEAFLRWLASRLDLRGGVRRIDDRLWQLGAWDRRGGTWECFYLRGGRPSEAGRGRLAAYRNAVLLWGLSPPVTLEDFHGPALSLLEVVRPGRPLAVADLDGLLRPGGAVRFDAERGVLHAGDVLLGEVPPGTREFHLLACLAEHLDRYVPYADLKHEVLRRSGGADATEEATFCQNLKSRIKRRWIPGIDRLIATTNKGEGYRLRGRVEIEPDG